MLYEGILKPVVRRSVEQCNYCGNFLSMNRETGMFDCQYDHVHKWMEKWDNSTLEEQLEFLRTLTVEQRKELRFHLQKRTY
jgi:hypothetical protein